MLVAPVMVPKDERIIQYSMTVHRPVQNSTVYESPIIGADLSLIEQPFEIVTVARLGDLLEV